MSVSQSTIMPPQLAPEPICGCDSRLGEGRDEWQNNINDDSLKD